MIRRIFGLFALLAGLLSAATASAHFNLNLNVRIYHVEHLTTGLRIYLRTPMPYLVADKMGPVGANGLPAPAPFTTNRQEPDRIAHLVDWDAFAADPLGLARIAADDLRIEASGKRLPATALDIRAHPIGQEPGFATLDEAKAAFGPGSSAFPASGQTYVGDTMVDVLLDYGTGAPVQAFEISSASDPGLPAQEETANLILDYGSAGTEIYRNRGLMNEPVLIEQAPAAATLTFVREGIRHILGGTDHVLFVLCLVIGAAGFRSLAARITGFTLGHSVTLTLGFFGYVPSGSWFVPTVETGIALSIIYAAAIAIAPTRRSGIDRDIFLVTFCIGLLHGLGFSFVLHEILRIDAPNLWQSLLAFNVGVEIGQLAIVAASWPTLVLLRRFDLRTWELSRLSVALGCIAVASLWVGQRAWFALG